MQPLPQQATQHLKAMVAYLKSRPQEKTYFNYLQAAMEAEEEASMELSQSLQSQVPDNTIKPRTTSFFPLWKLKGTHRTLKTCTMCLAHLEKESAEED